MQLAQHSRQSCSHPTWARALRQSAERQGGDGSCKALRRVLWYTLGRGPRVRATSMQLPILPAHLVHRSSSSAATMAMPSARPPLSNTEVELARSCGYLCCCCCCCSSVMDSCESALLLYVGNLYRPRPSKAHAGPRAFGTRQLVLNSRSEPGCYSDDHAGCVA